MLKYHLLELKYRLVYMVISILLTVVILWEDKENLMGSITGLDLIYTELSEGFISYLELCISFGLIINVPYINKTTKNQEKTQTRIYIKSIQKT